MCALVGFLCDIVILVHGHEQERVSSTFSFLKVIHELLTCLLVSSIFLQLRVSKSSFYSRYKLQTHEKEIQSNRLHDYTAHERKDS
jgi:hypothetical protein